MIAAAETCHLNGGRLLSIKSCIELEAFRQEMLELGAPIGNTYLLGIFAYADNKTRTTTDRNIKSLPEHLVTS